MSRIYRIRVSETLERVDHLEDGVALQLELLDILPRREMAGRLADALAQRGFSRVDGEPNVLELQPEEGVTIRVDAESGRVEARVSGTATISLKREKSNSVDVDTKSDIQRGEERLRKQLKAQLEQEATEHSDSVRQELTKKLEEHIAEVRPVLDRAVNEVTAGALKTRAAQLGEVESIEEDADSGSLVIRVKV